MRRTQLRIRTCQNPHGEAHKDTIITDTADAFCSSQDQVNQEKTTEPYTEMVESAEEARK